MRVTPVLYEDDMLIESITKRPNGTHPRLDGVTYDFVPNKAGDHVAEVTNKEHIKRLLSISTFRAYTAQAEPVEPVEPAQIAPPEPSQNSVQKDASKIAAEIRQKHVEAIRARSV